MRENGKGKRFNQSSAIVIIIALLLFLWGTALANQSDEESYIVDWNKSQAAYNNLLNESPGVRAYKTNGLTTRLYGRPFGTGSNPEQTAEQFRLNHSGIFGASADELIPGNLSPEKKRTQMLMYDKQTGQYKFTLVYYSQYKEGIPVFNSELRLLVRNVADYPLVLAVSTLHDVNSFSVDLNKVGVHSPLAEQTARAEVPTLTDFSEQETVIWAGINSELTAPKMAVKFKGSSDFPEQWLFVADPATGELFYKENQIIFEDVTGNVSGLATQGSGAEHCEEELSEPLPYARVNIDANVQYTDINGDFIFTGISGVVTVESRIWGEWFRVYNYTGSESVLSKTTALSNQVNFLHNSTNIESERSQVNAYIEANTIRDLVITHNPTYPSLQNLFPVYVNRTDGYCPGNAWYDPGQQSINFCNAGSGYPNTAWATVVHHEYGHHLINMAGSGQGQYGEGMGDCVGILITDESGTGFGFFGSCSQPLREANNSYQYPCSGEIHDCGQLLSGCIWSTRNELLATNPADYLDILSNLTINSILLHTGSQITPQITVDFLILDDDDGIIDNGTPHFNEICAGFGVHNMDCPALTPIWFSYPDGTPDVVIPNVETTFGVNVNAGGFEPVSGTGELFYSIDGAPYQSGTMVEIAPNEYEATLPATGCDSKIEWYVSAEASGIGTITDPFDAPMTAYSTIIATEVIISFSDDFETNQGWTVSGSVSDGAWERGIPVGGGDRGDPPTDYDGSGYCYLTDNVDGNSDVDDGTTILTSPVFDLSAGDALINYARWYSNNYGNDPYNDEMYVYISNDNGVSWTLVETIGPVDQASGGWFENSFMAGDFVTPTSTMKLRFNVSDLSAGSVVEAAIDAVTITRYECNTGLMIVTNNLPDWTEGVLYSQQLQAINGSGNLTWIDKYGDLAGTGLSLSTSGLLSGIPAASGAISFTAEVADDVSTYEKVLTININPALSVLTDSLPDWTAGQAYSQTLTASGGTGSHSWSDKNGDLVGTGLAVSSAGLLSGTPVSGGTLAFTAMVTDNVGATGEKSLTVTINPVITITTDTLPDGKVELAYSTQLVTSGGTGTKTFNDKNNDLTGTGLALDSTGLLSGVPVDTGSISFIAKVVDITGSADEKQFSFSIGPAYICGDIDGSDTEINIADLVYFVDYMFDSPPGPAPPIMEAADVDGSGELNIADLVYMVSYMFEDPPGPTPTCGL